MVHGRRLQQGSSCNITPAVRRRNRHMHGSENCDEGDSWRRERETRHVSSWLFVTGLAICVLEGDGLFVTGVIVPEAFKGAGDVARCRRPTMVMESGEATACDFAPSVATALRASIDGSSDAMYGCSAPLYGCPDVWASSVTPPGDSGLLGGREGGGKLSGALGLSRPFNLRRQSRSQLQLKGGGEEEKGAELAVEREGESVQSCDASDRRPEALGSRAASAKPWSSEDLTAKAEGTETKKEGTPLVEGGGGEEKKGGGESGPEGGGGAEGGREGAPGAGDRARLWGAHRVVGNGTFGVVYEATLEGGEKVAVKRVLQDSRYRNRELSIMRQLAHPNIVELKHFFFTSKDSHPNDVYLNLVMEFLPTTLHRCIKNHAKTKEPLPLLLTKLYAWQLLRSLAYLHRRGVCHRDIKPQNVLVDPRTHQAKLCDFGSAKRLTAQSSSIAYICSRFYRSPELILGGTEYSTAIDMWSFGCVLVEMLIGRPAFPGESSRRQLVAVARVLGLPDHSDLTNMKVNMTGSLREEEERARAAGGFAAGWELLKTANAPPDAIDLVSKVLVYSPDKRLSPLECLAHPFFDSLRSPSLRLPDNQPLPPLFALTAEEVSWGRELDVLHRILPSQARVALRDGTPVTSANVSPLTSRGPSPGFSVQG